MIFYDRFYGFRALSIIGKCTSRHLFAYGGLTSISLAQKIHIAESTKDVLDEIGGYETAFRGFLEVKVSKGCQFTRSERVYDMSLRDKWMTCLFFSCMFFLERNNIRFISYTNELEVQWNLQVTKQKGKHGFCGLRCYE